jgi:hypothetical protein
MNAKEVKQMPDPLKPRAKNLRAGGRIGMYLEKEFLDSPLTSVSRAGLRSWQNGQRL